MGQAISTPIYHFMKLHRKTSRLLPPPLSTTSYTRPAVAHTPAAAPAASTAAESPVLVDWADSADSADSVDSEGSGGSAAPHTPGPASAAPVPRSPAQAPAAVSVLPSQGVRRLSCRDSGIRMAGRGTSAAEAAAGLRGCMGRREWESRGGCRIGVCARGRIGACP